MYFKTDELQQEMLDDVPKEIDNLVNSTEGKSGQVCSAFHFYIFYEILYSENNFYM